RALRVARTAGARAGAALGQVAHAGGGAALRRRGLEAVRGAVVGDAVTALCDVAVARGGAADGRALRIGGAGRARAGAALGQVADTGGGATRDGCRLEPVRRTVVGDAVAALGGVTIARGGAADRRALHVGRTARTGAGAALGKI